MGDILSDLVSGLFDRLPKKVQTGCLLVFGALIVAAGIWWLIEQF